MATADPGIGADSPSVSVRDARKRFEQMSGTTGSSNDIHGSLRKFKPPLKKTVTSPTLQASVGNDATEPKAIAKKEDPKKSPTSEKKDRVSSTSKKSLFSKKSRLSSSEAKGVSRAASDAGILETKKSKFKAKMETGSKKNNGRSGSAGNSPKTSPTHSTTPTKSTPTSSPTHASLNKKDSTAARKRREPPRPPSEPGSPTYKSTAEATVKQTGKDKPKAAVKQTSEDKPKVKPDRPKAKGEDRPKASGGKKPARPPSPKKGIKDEDLKVALAGGTQLTGEALKIILGKQLAYLSGGLEDDKYPILTIPDVGLRQLESPVCQEDLNTTILYIKTLISADQLSGGLTLLLDARSSKTHAAVKIILEKISSQGFPVTVHMVYIFIKTGLFSRSKSLASPDITSKLHLAYLSDQKALLDQFESGNVTTDLGGSLRYDHKNWVYNRLEFEKMQCLYMRAKSRFPEVRDALDLLTVPESVKEAEQLMQEDLKLKEGLVNRLAEAELSIDRFLDVLQRQQDQGSLEVSLGTKDYIVMISSLNGMLEDVRKSQGKFDEFWGVHKARVDHMMRMCHFNRTAEKTKHLMQSHIDDLTGGGLLLGDTLESSLELGEKHELFVQKCKATMDEHMDHIREDAHILINPTFAPQETDENMHSATKEAIKVVKDKLANLTQTYQELMTLCQQKRDLFIVCVKFHMTTRQCQQWNQDALEFMATQPLEEPSSKVASSLISQIDMMVNRVQPAQMSAMMDLAAALPAEKQYNKTAQKTSQKYEQARELLSNRKASLMKIVATAAAASSASSTSKGGKSFKKNKIVHNEIELVNGDNTEAPPPSSASALTNPEASLFLVKTRANNVMDEYTDGESNSSVLKSRENVYRELVETETVYIKDMQTVVDAYYDAMDPDNMSIPLRLRGKRDIVFGNLLDIYNFHDSVFSKALDRYADQPERVGECFTQFTQEFQMYSDYCKNRSSSETLVNETTESQAFFKGIQRNLAHALDLNAYLLKPVQRITKYQLLLKDMMKHSANAEKAYSDLKIALDRMLKVLKNLNDSLHVVGLKGFPGALAEQGRLLVHDAFNVWDGGASSRSLFSRGRERHVFLFEKVIIFSKKIEVPEERKKKKADAYLYKGHLDMTDIALRDDTQPLQFALTVHGQSKLYKFQATTKEICTMWVSEIRRLLQVQFTLMKDKVIKSGTLDRRSYKGKTKLSTRTRGSQLFGESIKEEPQHKKSLSDRFKILKRNKKANPDPKKSLKATASLNTMDPESSLLLSCSVPPSLKFSIAKAGGPRGSFDHSGLSKSNIETGAQHGDDSNSSDDDLDLSYEDDDAESATVDHYESLAPGAARYYSALTAYNPGDSEENGINLSEDQQVEVIGINPYGWWWVRITNDCNGEMEEGWVPASYLRVIDELKSEGCKSITYV